MIFASSLAGSQLGGIYIPAGNYPSQLVICQIAFINKYNWLAVTKLAGILTTCMLKGTIGNLINGQIGI